MKLSILLLLFFLVTSASYSQQLKKLKISELEDYINKSEKPLLVNFWATFCQPCVEELPYFQSIIKEKYNGQVELLLVSLDLPDYYPAKISSFIKTRHVTAPTVWLNESNADMFCPRIDKSWEGTIPASLFINNKKNYRKFHEGQLTSNMLKKELAELTK